MPVVQSLSPNGGKQNFKERLGFQNIRPLLLWFFAIRPALSSHGGYDHHLMATFPLIFFYFIFQNNPCLRQPQTMTEQTRYLFCISNWEPFVQDKRLASEGGHSNHWTGTSRIPTTLSYDSKLAYFYALISFAGLLNCGNERSVIKYNCKYYGKFSSAACRMSLRSNYAG